jgi:hypothetical protein
MLLVCCRMASASGRLAAAAPATHASPAAAGGPTIDPMAAMTARLDALKHAAQAREQVHRRPFRMVTGKLKADAARAVYRVDEGTFDSLVLYRQKLAGLESDSGDLQWAAMPKGCGICMSGRSRQGGRG